MLTPKRVLEIEAAEAICLLPENETGMSRAELRELIEAWRAWHEWRGDQLKRQGINPTTEAVRWVYEGHKLDWTFWSGGAVSPQAAVLATLGPKGEPDATKD